MSSFYDTLFSEMESRLEEIAAVVEEPLMFSEEAIKTIIAFIEKLKLHFGQSNCETQSDEINFFKVIKPKFLSALIYHNEILRIESNRPSSNREQRRFFIKELRQAKLFYHANSEFCKYYRTSNDCFDTIYFLRRPPEVRLAIDTTYYLFDQAFSTMHDYTVAKILANRKIEEYFRKELKKLEMAPIHVSEISIPRLTWTGSKAGLVELIYALHTEGVFNNGVSDLKEVALFLESIFGVNLGQYHRVFLEIRNRKNERTKFLNSLKERLERRMENADET